MGFSVSRVTVPALLILVVLLAASTCVSTANAQAAWVWYALSGHAGPIAQQSVYMVSETEGWIVGSGGNILRCQQGGWSGNYGSTVLGGPFTGEPGRPHETTGPGLNSVYALNDNDAWAVGYGGTVIHWDGTHWTLQKTGIPSLVDLYSVFMVGPSEGWAVGSHTAIFYYNGRGWSPWPLTCPVSGCPDEALRSIYMVSSSEGWAVGSHGTIFHFDGSNWAPYTRTHPTDNFLLSVYMVNSGEGWAVGTGGTILHYACTSGCTSSNPIYTWDAYPFPGSVLSYGANPVTLYSVFMRGSTGWAVGTDGTRGIVAHYASLGSSTFPTWYAYGAPTGTGLYSGWLGFGTGLYSVFILPSGTEGWAVGDEGMMLHYSLRLAPAPPTVVTLPATDVTATQALLHGTVNPNGRDTMWQFTITDPSGAVTNCPSTSTPQPADTIVHDISCQVNTLTPSTTYSYTISASNDVGYSPPVLSVLFTTASVPPPPPPSAGAAPTVVTFDASDITATSAILHGTVNPNGLDTVWQFTMTDPSGAVTNCPVAGWLQTADSFVHNVSCPVTNLAPSTRYDFILNAHNSAGISSGRPLWFTTAVAGTPGFKFACDPPSVNVLRGGSVSSLCTVTSLFGFNAAVSLSGSWSGTPPTGVTATFVPPSVTLPADGAAATTLTITTSGSASPGIFTYHVTGTSGTLAHSLDVTVSVTAATTIAVTSPSGAGTPDFTIASSSSSLSLGPGASTTCTISVQSLGTFSSPVDLTASGAPSGLNLAFGTTPVMPSAGGTASSVLTVTVTGAPAGDYPITITGTSGTMIHTTALTVHVAAAGGHCLIATAAYGSELSPEVQFLRGFRDNSILRTKSGSAFMVTFNAWYYSFSPTVADFIRGNPLARTVTRLMLYPLMGILRVGAFAFGALPWNLEVAAIVSGLLVSSLIGIVYLSPPLAVASARSRRVRRIAKRLELPAVAVMLGALVGVAFIAAVNAASVFMMFSTAAVVLATLAASALYTSRASLHILRQAYVSGNA